MQRTSISWVLGPDGSPGWTFNPFAGCSAKPISQGCEHCWAAGLASTRLAHRDSYNGLAKDGRWTGKVTFFPGKLGEPLCRRTPSGIFVGDMGDIGMLPIGHIAAIFGVMAATPWHRYYVLSKHLAGLRSFFNWAERGDADPWTECHWAALSDELETVGDGGPIHTKSGGEDARPWPLPNVWIGTSCCTRDDLHNLDELREIPAAVRFVSFEPLLEDLGKLDLCGIRWAIPGGESGSKARPCAMEWIESVILQCREAGVPCWVKQLGEYIVSEGRACTTDAEALETFGFKSRWLWRANLKSHTGADPNEWPQEYRVREVPEALR